MPFSDRPASMRLYGLSTALVLVAVLGCAKEPVAPPETRGLEGVLVYGLNARGDFWPNNMAGLWSIRPDGDQPRQYFAMSAAYLSPSPDLSRVAFSWQRRVSIGDARAQVLTKPLDSTFNHVYGKTWSPDGSWLAFQLGNGVQGTAGLATISIDGTMTDFNARFTSLTSCSGATDPYAIPLLFRRWVTPDRLEFEWPRCGAVDRRYTARPDGSEMTEIANVSISWPSPDGARVLYFQGFGSLSVPWTSRPDGTDPRTLTAEVGRYKISDWLLPYPWSPDGRHLVLLRTEGGCEQPYILSVDGTSERPLESSGCWVFHSWSPDGQWVAATLRDDPAGAVIHLLKRDGSARRTLTVGASTMQVADVAWLREQ